MEKISELADFVLGFHARRRERGWGEGEGAETGVAVVFSESAGFRVNPRRNVRIQ